MKKKHLFLLLITFSIVFSVNAQQPQTVEDEYAAYFKLPRESVYLHLNKTSYLAGEEIWFKGYTYDQKNQLTSKATTNINVGIYDAEGNQIKKALFKANNGITKGNFAVDSTFTAGTYFIKAETNWMKNFKESDAYVQKIEIITDKKTPDSFVETTESFDFQFLPEGGHIVANTLSNVGFKVIDMNGKGVAVSGIVYDEYQNQVASFESNTLGMGKFLFQPKQNIQYTAEIKLENGTTITETLPKADQKGVSMILNNPFEDKIIINFSTNEETLAYNPTKQYKVLVHQSGNLKTINLTFDGTEKTISVPKKDLFKGVNTVTVFDHNDNPILERLFFNDYFVKKSDIKVSHLTKVKDSLVLSIDELALQKDANVSISILPETTKSYNPEHNILSNFYLKPHVRGYVENPQYYFRNMDRKKKYELDILLLTQGWSRYDWNDIFEEKPNALNRFENGISITGRVNKPNEGIKSIFLYGTKNHKPRFIELDENQEFRLDNFFLEEGEEIRFSYADKKGNFKKPSMYLRFNVNDKADQISEMILENSTLTDTEKVSFSLPADFYYNKTEQLDPVALKMKKKREYRDEISVNGRVKEISVEDYHRFYDIPQFLRFNGFYVTERLGEVLITTPGRSNGRDRTVFARPLVYLDGVRLSTFDILSSFSLANVEKIIIDKSVAGEVVNATRFGGGVIKIITRRSPLFKNNPSEKMYIASTAPYAFKAPKEYYSPNYSSFNNQGYKEYGVISWIPELKLETAQATDFKIYDTNAENITLFIEGISEDGDLISEQRTLQVR
ncbi:hypothetical protein U8527_03875 [Kordia algicida OT-1]|uniref:TonB-dependent receptor plug domain-containing protein n=1 Tax=Kordia algicida OT-1 TaxID=391587 RepID=A9DPL2_9FLAO|nr:hypothetical protein [Kordia algicida]EDP97462.1 hypothetical protein KAOT1_19907 [Kordia algicida OT-1]